MKHLTLISIFTFGIIGCDLGERPSTPSEPLLPIFRVTDTSGHEATTFNSGEDFDISFSVVNTTGKRLTVYREDSSPDVIFRILQADSVVVTSIDGYTFSQVATTGYIEPGQTLEGRWRAPSTSARTPRMLAPGLYKVQALYPRFDEVGVKQVSPISISIIQ